MGYYGRISIESAVYYFYKIYIYIYYFYNVSVFYGFTGTIDDRLLSSQSVCSILAIL